MKNTAAFAGLLICLALAGHAQTVPFEKSELQPGWQTVVLNREIPDNRSRNAMEADMLSRARILVAEKVSGVKVSTIEALTTSEQKRDSEGRARQNQWHQDYLYFTKQEVTGRIVNEKAPIFEAFTDGDRQMLRLTYSAKADAETDRSDAGFTAELRTRQPSYRPNDTVRIEVESSRDAQLYLFNISAKGEGIMIWPNTVETDNSLARGRRTFIPKSTSRYAFVAELPDDYDPTEGPSQELLYGILFNGNEQLFNPEDAFIKTWQFDELNRKLMLIPGNMRTEVMSTYGVTE